jgi:hypothetical protein
MQQLFHSSKQRVSTCTKIIAIPSAAGPREAMRDLGDASNGRRCFPKRGGKGCCYAIQICRCDAPGLWPIGAADPASGLCGAADRCREMGDGAGIIALQAMRGVALVVAVTFVKEGIPPLRQARQLGLSRPKLS